MLFFILCMACFFILFKVNVGVYKYYYNRNLNLNLDIKKPFSKIKKIYTPAFKTLVYKFKPLKISAKCNVLRELEFVYKDDKYDFFK